MGENNWPSENEKSLLAEKKTTSETFSNKEFSFLPKKWMRFKPLSDYLVRLA